MSEKKFYFFLLGAFVPFLYFLSPNWFEIEGVGPSWVLLWLLPWAIEKGPLAGGFAGLCLGLLLDGFFLEGATNIPSLILIGFCWGRLALKGPSIKKSFNFGLLAFLGCLINGFFLWSQNIILFNTNSLIFFNASMFHTLLAQSIITALIAPMSSSLLLLTFFRSKV